jgi:hypothetical protein
VRVQISNARTNREGGWEGVLHPDDVAAAIGGHARDGRYEAEYRLRRADNTFRWHFARARIVHAPDRSERWLGTAVDIDDRKLAEVERLATLERELSLRLQDEEASQHQRRIGQRLLLLVEASSALLASPDSDLILKNILGMATRFVSASLPHSMIVFRDIQAPAFSFRIPGHPRRTGSLPEDC